MYIFKTIFKDLSLLCRGRPPSAPEIWLETSRSVFFFIIKFTAKLQENITSIILEKLLKAEGRFAATELYLNWMPYQGEHLSNWILWLCQLPIEQREWINALRTKGHWVTSTHLYLQLSVNGERQRLSIKEERGKGVQRRRRRGHLGKGRLHVVSGGLTHRPPAGPGSGPWGQYWQLISPDQRPALPPG